MFWGQSLNLHLIGEIIRFFLFRLQNYGKFNEVMNYFFYLCIAFVYCP